MKKLFLPLFLLTIVGSAHGMRGGSQVEQKGDFDLKIAVTIVWLKKDHLAPKVTNKGLNNAKRVINQEASTLSNMSKGNIFSHPSQTVDGAKQRAILIEKAAMIIRLKKDCPVYVDSSYMAGIHELVKQITETL